MSAYEDDISIVFWLLTACNNAFTLYDLKACWLFKTWLFMVNIAQQNIRLD